MKYAIVTGAGFGIGLAIAKALTADGWFVICLDRHQGALDQLKVLLPEERIHCILMDVRSVADWAAAISEILDLAGGRLDLLVNNAGIIFIKPFRDSTLHEIRDLVDVNLIGMINGVKTCLPLLEATPGSAIISMGSISARKGFPHAAVYSATKSAITNLTEVLAIEFKERGIAVCDILPAMVDTAIFDNDDRMGGILDHLRRFGIGVCHPDRVAAVVMKATRSNKIHHVVGSQARIFLTLAYLWPGVVRLILGKFSRNLDRYIEHGSKS